MKHFSKYGLHDSDEEGEPLGKPLAYHAANANANPIKVCSQASSLLSRQMATDRQHGHDMDARQEKDMIAKQIKLIETRRLELF